jgi:hypothetical protein
MSDTTPAAAAGWYPAGVEGQERYWDGATWTDQVRPVAVAAGWYPGGVPGEERYWDGAAWTDQVRPAGTEAAAAPVATGAFAASAAPEPAAIAGGSAVGAPGAAAPGALGRAASAAPGPAFGTKNKPAKQKWIIGGSIAAGVLVIGMVGSALGAGRDSDADTKPVAGVEQVEQEADASAEDAAVEEDTTVSVPEVVGKTVAEARAALEAAGFTVAANEGAGEDWSVLSQSPVSGEKAQPGSAVSVNAEAPKPVYTVEQENALESAHSYLRFSGFSRLGLIEQLSSEYGEGYPLDVATWAVDTVGADWNAEAVESAKSYLEFSSFSRDGLFEQLTSEYGEQFTPDEANYALSQVGY